MKSKSKLQIARDSVKNAIIKVNYRMEVLGKYDGKLFDKLKILQQLFENIRNVPGYYKFQCTKYKKIGLNWIEQTQIIEKEFNSAQIKGTGTSVVATGSGVAVATIGPSVAMGVATTFGVASTGTAISTLSGIAATNAAVAWIGGGTLALGGGGVAAGEMILSMAGPIGWAIAGIAILGTGIAFWNFNKEKSRLENIFILISERDAKCYELAIIEMDERVKHIRNEIMILDKVIKKIQSFGVDYNKLSKQQQIELGSYVNLLEASIKLLVNPILGLAPKFTCEDFENFVMRYTDKSTLNSLRKVQNLIVGLANLLYGIKLDEADKQVLYKFLKKNKDFLKTMHIEEKDFDNIYLTVAMFGIEHKQKETQIYK